MTTLLEKPKSAPLPADDEVERRVPEGSAMAPTAEASSRSAEAELCLASLYGRFDDLVKIDTWGRAHRPDSKFMSNYELEQIARHQNQIRQGIPVRQAELTVHERRDTLPGQPTDVRYRARHAKAPQIDRSAWSAATDEAYDGQHRAESPARTPIPLSELGHAERIARIALERQRQMPPPETVRTPLYFPGLRHWWREDVAPFDKAVAIGGVVTVAAIWGAVYLSPHDPVYEEEYGQTDPGLTQTTPAAPDFLEHSSPHQEVAPIVALQPTDIRIPHGLTLKVRPAGDSIWHEAETHITPGGHRMAEAQIAEVTQQVMRDNGIHSEYEAEHLPVGFKAKVTDKVRNLVKAFAGHRK